MTNKLNRLFIALSSVCVLGISLTASAIDLTGNTRQDVSEAEWALAPPYCPYTMGRKNHKQPHINKWVGLMGPSFFHMHHYCWGLFDFHRAERSDLNMAEKKVLFGRALSNFRYVIRNSTEDFILLPEVHTWIGRAEIRLGHPKEAGEAFATAWTLKLDYWPPYFHWAEFLQSHGKKAESLEILKVGLQYSPDAKPLLLLFKQLGGNKEDIPSFKTPNNRSSNEINEKNIQDTP